MTVTFMQVFISSLLGGVLGILFQVPGNRGAETEDSSGG